MTTEAEIIQLLGGNINIGEIALVVDWASGTPGGPGILLDIAKSSDGKPAKNALWSLTHLQKSNGEWLQSKQDELIDMLLVAEDVARKRMLLQLLRNQSYGKDCLRTDFLDYCLSKINAECEPYAIRCFSLYCAFKMCRHYPELIAELELCLEMLDCQSLSSGLLSALKTTRRMIGSVCRGNRGEG